MSSINFNSRTKKNKELSNFYPCNLPVNDDDDDKWVLTTVEHEYQAMKFESSAFGHDHSYAALVRAAPSAKEAKRLGGKKAWIEYNKKNNTKMKHMTKVALAAQFKANVQVENV